MTPEANLIRCEFEAWLTGDRFSCLGARASARRGVLELDLYGALGDDSTAGPLHRTLERFGGRRLSESEDFATYVAVFDGPRDMAEETFETLLWKELSLLHDIDVERYSWASEVSADPGDPAFAFSIAGSAYFVVGMHPKASRISRRFRLPALAFNAHQQFQRLRRSGAYIGLRDRIRERELRLQGSLQPHLADHGTASEAIQYAGRHVNEGWTCPWRRREVHS